MVRKWRRLKRIRDWILGCWLGGIATELILFPMMGVFPSVKYQILFTCGVLTVVWFSAALAGCFLSSYINAHMQQTLVERDVANLGCWIDLLFAPINKMAYPQEVKSNENAARPALLEQLPLLTVETACLLRANERYMLYKTLAGNDAELISAVLGVVPLFADARALPFVQHLANGNGMANGNIALQSEAQSSLDRLQVILNHSRGEKALLRASHSPQTPGDALLKPVQEPSDRNAAELMRADLHSGRGELAD